MLLLKVLLRSGMIVWGYVLVALIPILALVQLIRMYRVYKVAYPRALAGDVPSRKNLIEMVNSYYLMNLAVFIAVALIVVSHPR